jgi:hypothetical protein
MKYLKKLVPAADLDALRINLSVKEDALTADPGLPDYVQRVRHSPEPVCDWCADAAPVYVYAASRTSAGEAARCWRWLACERCNRMIENGNWDALERRVAARFTKFFAAKLESRYKGGVSASLISEAVHSSLKQFHDYAIVEGEPEPQQQP